MAIIHPSALLPSTFSGFLLAIIGSLLSYQAAIYLYNIFLHPLRKFRGPVTSAASNFPLIRASTNGDFVKWTVELHERYGEVVRISPDELSFSGAEAYKDVYGHRKAGGLTLEKDPSFYGGTPGNDHDVAIAGVEDHARQRRIFTHAFSDRALKLQEPLFLTYANQLVQKLREAITQDPKKVFNMVEMYNFTTFDIMGDLTFGERLGMLADSSYHPWVSTMFSNFRFGTYINCIRQYPTIETLLMKYCIPKSLMEKRKIHQEFSIQRVDRRLEKEEERPDIWGLVLKRDEATSLTKEEMYSNARLFMIAGTETTATLLSGLTYYLLINPDTLRKLTKELRQSFEDENDITIERLQALPYLNACIEEGLRMYPPVSLGLPRITPPGPPTSIAGNEIPTGMRVRVTTLAANRNPNNWKNPYSFVPERWLTKDNESSQYVNDKRFGMMPFSTGPRGCLGKNMAYHEMRLILTKVLYNFDLTLMPESKAWIDHKTFILWDKPALYCQLQPVSK